MNQWCIKIDKNVFKLAFRFRILPEISKVLETHVHTKDSIFNATAKLFKKCTKNPSNKNALKISCHDDFLYYKKTLILNGCE